MNGDMAVLITLAVTILVLGVAETHVAFVTLALCAGYVLEQFVGSDALDLLDNYLNPDQYPLYEIVHVGLLLIPALLVGIRFRRTQRGMKRFVQQLVPGLALALLLAIFLINILPDTVAQNIRDESYLASNLETMSPLLVIFALATAIFDVLLKHAKEPGEGKKGPGRPRKG